MKKVIALILTLTLLIGSLTACKKKVEPETPDDGGKVDVVEPGVETPETPEEPKELTGKLIVWSFTNELQAHTLAFQEANPGIEVEYTEISMNSGEYQVKVQAAAGTDEVPDCVALEAAFVREWVESDLLLDLSDLLPKAEALDVYQNTIDVGTYDGEVRAFSYQSTPGAVFYRRSLAKEYFGTDDPVEIQNLMSDMTKFEAMAQTVKEKSNGDTYMVSSSGDFMNLYYANREQPWVVDGKLTIDPKVDQLMDIAKTFREKGYESQATQWEEGWFAGMNDSLADASGNPKQVFSYFLPTWGLPYTLMPNAGDTAGDWACINGPLPYQWGGTWVGAMKNAKNVETAKAFVEFVALNEQNLTNWATGVYTNEYLQAIDPSIGDSLEQGPGDFVCSKKVVDAITPLFDDSEASAFLAGQNSYKGFAEAAKNVSARLIQGTDDAIQNAFNDPLTNYITGSATKEQAIQQFKDAVSSELPDIDVN